MSGDRDYIKLVTLLRNRFGQRVVIVGVPGAVSSDLVTAAGESDDVEVAPTVPVDMHQLKSAIVAMVKKGPAPLAYWTVKTIDQWAQDERQCIPGTAKQRRDAIHELLQEQVLIRQQIDTSKRGPVTATILDEAKARENGYLV